MIERLTCHSIAVLAKAPSGLGLEMQHYVSV